MWERSPTWDHFSHRRLPSPLFNRNSIAKHPNCDQCQHPMKMVPDVGTFPTLGPFFTQEASITLVQLKQHCQKSKSRPMPASHENGPRFGNVPQLGTIFHTGGFQHPCSTETAFSKIQIATNASITSKWSQICERCPTWDHHSHRRLPSPLLN